MIPESRTGSKQKLLMAAAAQTHRVDLVDPFPSLVTLPSDPVAVEVGTDPVQDLTGEAVVLPLLGVKLQHALIHQVLAVLRTGTGSGVLKLQRDEDAEIQANP